MYCSFLNWYMCILSILLMFSQVVILAISILININRVRFFFIHFVLKKKENYYKSIHLDKRGGLSSISSDCAE